MKKILILLFLSIAPLQAMELSEKMYVKEKLLSWTTSFNIETDESRVGTVYRKFFTFTTEYHLENLERELVAKAISRFWSLGMIFDIEDANGKLLGVVEERLLKLLPTFEIFSPTGGKLAKARLNFWGTTYTIKDSFDDHVIATIYRPYFRLLNNWTITIEDMDAINEKNIHPHMFLVLAAFQVDAEAWQNASMQTQYAYTPFVERLDREREYLEMLTPAEEDYLYINNCDPDEVLWLLDTDQLTPNQKSALLRIVSPQN